MEILGEHMILNIAILDDEKQYRDEITEVINGCDIPYEYNIDIFEKSEELLNSEKNYQVAFVDVELAEEKNGFAVAKEFKDKNGDTLIVFVTTHEEMSTEGYLVNAFRYIFKKNMTDKIEEAVNSALVIVERNMPIEFEVGNGNNIAVPIKNILYIENENRKTRLYVKEADYIIKRLAKETSEKLMEKGFVSPHKSYLVNSIWVDKVTTRDVILKNKTKIPLSKLKRSYIEWQIALNKSR